MGDLTTDSIFKDEYGKGLFIAKQEGVLAGLDAVTTAYSLLHISADVDVFKHDGESVHAGESVATVSGSISGLLKAERTILNTLQHLSGIATTTRAMVDALDDASILITDTRKTLPGLRALQKYAVRCGGGKNHRFRLDDAVMIKDNHIKGAGGITHAVQSVRNHIGHTVKIEVETETREQVLEAVNNNVDIIMLDNRSAQEVQQYRAMIPGHILIEVSGGITPENIQTYKGCGADVLSMGWLTHSVTALDISFNLIQE